MPSAITDCVSALHGPPSYPRAVMLVLRSLRGPGDILDGIIARSISFTLLSVGFLGDFFRPSTAVLFFFFHSSLF